MKIKVKEVLVFKSPQKVDWEATEDKVVDKILNEYPDMRASEMAMTADKFMHEIHKVTHRIGVNKLYNQFNA